MFKKDYACEGPLNENERYPLLNLRNILNLSTQVGNIRHFHKILFSLVSYQSRAKLLPNIYVCTDVQTIKFPKSTEGGLR